MFDQRVDASRRDFHERLVGREVAPADELAQVVHCRRRAGVVRGNEIGPVRRNSRAADPHLLGPQPSR